MTLNFNSLQRWVDQVKEKKWKRGLIHLSRTFGTEKVAKMNSFVSHNDLLPGEAIILKFIWPQDQFLFNCSSLSWKSKLSVFLCLGLCWGISALCLPLLFIPFPGLSSFSFPSLLGKFQWIVYFTFPNRTSHLPSPSLLEVTYFLPSFVIVKELFTVSMLCTDSYALGETPLFS